jgi:hypothetical protein
VLAQPGHVSGRWFPARAPHARCNTSRSYRKAQDSRPSACSSYPCQRRAAYCCLGGLSRWRSHASRYGLGETPCFFVLSIHALCFTDAHAPRTVDLSLVRTLPDDSSLSWLTSAYSFLSLLLLKRHVFGVFLRQSQAKVRC